MATREDRAVGSPGAGTSAVEVGLLVLLGGACGLLLLLVPVPARELTSTTLTWASTVTALVLVSREQRRRRDRRSSEGGHGPPEAAAYRFLDRPPVRRAYAVVMGLLTAQIGLVTGSVVLAVAVVLAGALAGAVLPLLVRRSQRRQRGAAASTHPGAAVVLVALVDLASMRLAQWARAARATLPADLGGAGVLAADADGIALHRSGRPERLVHRWPWEEVELSAGPHPDDPGDLEAAALVLTLLGPRPAPRTRAVPLGRRRFDVTLAVRDGLTPARRSVVDAAVEALEARRPHPGDGSEIATVASVG